MCGRGPRWDLGSDVVRVDPDRSEPVDLGPALAGPFVLDERRLVAGAREDALAAQLLGWASPLRGAARVILEEAHDRHPQVGGRPNLVAGLGELVDDVAVALAQVERDAAVRRRVAEVEVDLAVARRPRVA